MNLFEQAAKRLEELQRAGIGTDASGEHAGVEHHLPTPEALVRVIEARERAGIDANEPKDAATDAASPAAVPFAAPLDAAIRARGFMRTPATKIDLDLKALAARGFVSPEAPSQILEEFRDIKRPIIRNAFGKSGPRLRNGNLIMVTSAMPREGKTFTAVNLALSIALEIDSTVLLVDGDVAHPQLPDVLGTPRSPGLLDLLTRDDVTVGDTLLRTNVEKLTVMPAGSSHPRATELLASAQMASLVQDLGSRYPDRLVIFDSPPLLLTTEARVLASHMGQIVMVVSADSTAQNAVRTAMAAIESCDVVLTVLNKCSQTNGSYYGYYGYGVDGKKR